MNVPHKRTCVTCTNRSELFNLMSKKELEMIDETRYEVEYNPGEIIFKQGTRTTQMISINYGLAKAYIEGFDNRNLVLGILKPTEIIGGPGTYVDNMHHFSVMAIEPTHCCFFDLTVFKKVVRSNNKISDYVIRSVSIKSINYFHKFISLTQKNVNGRIAETLLYLHDEVYKTNPMKLSISRQDLADMTGMTKDTTTRVLKDLSQDGIINCNNDNIQIDNFDKLKMISQFG